MAVKEHDASALEAVNWIKWCPGSIVSQTCQRYGPTRHLATVGGIEGVSPPGGGGCAAAVPLTTDRIDNPVGLINGRCGKDTQLGRDVGTVNGQPQAGGFGLPEMAVPENGSAICTETVHLVGIGGDD